MLSTKEKSKVKSRCGIDCEECKFMKEKVCIGCTHIKKPFWSDNCPIKTCCENKQISCCGDCNIFPCELLKSFAYDKDNGDNGLRIENCKKWCDKE